MIGSYISSSFRENNYASLYNYHMMNLNMTTRESKDLDV